MSCYKCGTHTYEDDNICGECYDDCDPIDSDCIIYNSKNKTSFNLPNLGISGATSLSRLARIIDEKYGFALTTTLTGINWYNVAGSENVSTIKETLSLIFYYLDNYKTRLDGVDISFNELAQEVEDLQDSLQATNNPSLSSTDLGINPNDNLKVVLNKIIDHLEPLVDVPELEITSDGSIEGGVTGNIINLRVDISEAQGNQLTLAPDGLYAQGVDVAALLTTIKNNPTLFTQFSNLIKSVAPCQKFHIQNTSPSSIIVNYINCTGVSTSATVGSNSSTTITNVREIITSPHSQLIITYKGIGENV